MAFLKQDFYVAPASQAGNVTNYKDRSGTKVVKIILQTGVEAKGVFFEVVNKYGDVVDVIATWAASNLPLFRWEGELAIGGGEEIRVRTTGATAAMTGYVYNEEPK